MLRKRDSGWEKLACRSSVETRDRVRTGRRIRGGREEGERGSEGGTRGKTGAYRKNPTLFYFTRTTSDALHRILSAPPPYLLASFCPPHLSALGAAFPVAVSSPFAPYLARASPFPSFSPSLSFSLRIRSSPSISRPLLFLLSICALSGRFEAR